MAMHIHSSFSEQTASMDSHLSQATKNAVDVLWWTEHDARLDGFGYRDVVHFTSLTEEHGGPGQGGTWHWQQTESGPLAKNGSGGGIVSQPITPNDPDPHGSMSLSALSTGSASASFGFYADSRPAGWNYHDNLTGQSLSIDVLLDSGWENGYLELRINSSFHEASGGRGAGFYNLNYQFVPGDHAGGRTSDGNLGIVTIPVRPDRPGDWTTVTITPSDDIAAIWPDLDYRDFALWGLTLSAVSTGDAVSGYFDYLRFDRTNTGGEFLSQQESMAKALAVKYPNVVQIQGLECSWASPHCNWFGPNITVPTYQGVAMNTAAYLKYLKNTVLPGIHSAGGLYSYNHPFGTPNGPLLSASAQSARLQAVATNLLPTGALGADLLEVGYPLRGHCGIGTHLGLWDVFSRNSIFLTGTGSSDDHFGQDWRNIANNWISSAWAASTGIGDLTAAMAAGQLWCGSLAEFGSPQTSLNLTVDGTCPMGSVSLSTLTSRQLTVYATGLPSGGSLQVLQGTVDYAGTAHPVPDTAVIATYTAAELASGQATMAVDTSSESFVRTVVADASGTIVGASNPAWLLQKTPPNGIPAPRQV
jgi:hypothetical protein